MITGVLTRRNDELIGKGFAMFCVCVWSLFLAVTVQAQLTDNCTVSILNRTAQVKPDGTWITPNIPANFGQVRARATCVENGITRSGQSDLFTIPPNRRLAENGQIFQERLRGGDSQSCPSGDLWSEVSGVGSEEPIG